MIIIDENKVAKEFLNVIKYVAYYSIDGKTDYTDYNEIEGIIGIFKKYQLRSSDFICPDCGRIIKINGMFEQKKEHVFNGLY